MLTIDHCSWDAPGHDPFRGDVAAAVAHYREIPPAVRKVLTERIARHAYDDVAEIRRDTVAGAHEYTGLRSMHFGNRLCRNVSRARWTDASVERGLVYCEAGHCVIVPTVCNNLSLITRLKPRDLPPVLEFVPEPEIVLPLSPAEPPVSLTEVPVTTIIPTPVPTFDAPGGPPSAWWPPVYVGFPPPTFHTPPVIVPPPHAVPEPSTWALFGLGLLALLGRRIFSPTSKGKA